MQTTHAPRIYRRRSSTAKEGTILKKENQPEHSFFGEPSHEPFFKPAGTIAPAQSLQRKCADCEKDEKKVHRMPEKKEKEKIHRVPEKKEEEKKVMKKEDKKEEEKKVMKKEDKKEEEKKVMKKAVGVTPATPAANYINSMNSKGNPLPAKDNHFFSSKMGYDFSGVKIHTGTEAADSAKDVNAKAYTIGNDIVFNEGQFNTGSTEGKKLMAHELAHVMQQSNIIQKQPALTPVPTPPPVPVTEYSPGTGFAKEFIIPAQDPANGPDSSSVQVSAGEQVLFNVSASDKDRKRVSPSGPWVESDGAGPYEIDFKITGDAEFDSVGSKITSKQIASLKSRTVPLFIQSTWDSKTAITITATVKDNAPAVVAPDIGSVKDADKVYTWNFVARIKTCPTSLKKIDGPAASAWTKTAGQYSYLAMPDLGKPGRPDYQGQTVLEQFGAVSALGFSMSDLDPTWLTANPSLTTPDQVATFLWGSGLNGTFVFDIFDTITDMHSGFGFVPPFPFTVAAYQDADGVGYSIVQKYLCGGAVIATLTIDRRFTKSNVVEVRKSDP